MVGLLSQRAPIDIRGAQGVALLHKLECKACPLNLMPDGKLEPTGAVRPLVYILGEAAGATEAEEREQFVGESGQLLRAYVPRKYKDALRFNNCARSHPPRNETPDKTIIECFPAGTVVSAVGGIKGAYRRLYTGPLTTVKTKGGRVLSGTPNHPVITGEGQTPLADLKVGQNLFCSGRDNGSVNEFPFMREKMGGPYVEDKPAFIGEVFGALTEVFHLQRVDSSPLDFHGDGAVDGQVDIVRANSELGPYGQGGLKQEQELFKRGLQGGDKASCSFSSVRKGFRVFGRNFSPKALLHFFKRVGLTPGYSALRSITQLGVLRLQVLFYAPGQNSFRACNLFHAFSAKVAGGYFGFRLPFGAVEPRLFPRVSKRHPSAYNKLAHSPEVGSSEACEGSQAHSFRVELDEVVSVETNGEFSGHVFNLETGSGEYFAGGILVSNCCRPSVIREIEKRKPKVILGYGNTPLEWVSGFNGITLWRGRRMPVKVGNHTCWFYPMLHPAYLIRQRRGNGAPSEEERMFGFDMRRAFAEVEGLPQAKVHSALEARRGVETISGEGGDDDLERLSEALAWAAREPLIGVDYETNGIRPYAHGRKILSAAVGTAERAVAFGIDHPEVGWTPEQKREVKALWLRFLKTAKGRKAVHNLSFELEWGSYFFGEEIIRAGRWEDTSTQAAILDERKGNKRAGPFSLEFLVQQYFGFNIKKMSGIDRSDLENVPLEAVLQYNAPDARYHALLYQQQAARIEEEGLEEAYELGLRTVPTVILTQMKGLPVDQKEVKRLKNKYENARDTALVKIDSLPIIREFVQRKGRPFKALSNPDVLYVFKDMLKRREVLVEDKYTKKGKYSADEGVLEKIDHPLAELLLSLRSVNKNLSTYILPLVAGGPESLIYPDGLLHAQFNTVFAETGRLSAQDPNLQNFPKRDNDAKEVRKQVVAAPGCLMMAFDMGQIEARVIAMFTKDKRFCKALWERYDIHMEWAERLAHAYPSRVGGKKNLSDKKAMKDFRTDVKNQWTFPLFFGAKLESAAGYLDIPVEIIKPHYNEFWRQFSGVKAWQETQLEFYQENGYVECLTGRRRHGPLSTNQIFNSPVQGTAAAIVLDAMSRISETGDPELQPEINIHDDLTWARIPEKRVDDYAERVLDLMLKPAFPWINVPLTVEGHIGKNWLDMEEFGVFSSDEWKK